MTMETPTEQPQEGGAPPPPPDFGVVGTGEAGLATEVIPAPAPPPADPLTDLSSVPPLEASSDPDPGPVPPAPPPPPPTDWNALNASLAEHLASLSSAVLSDVQELPLIRAAIANIAALDLQLRQIHQQSDRQDIQAQLRADAASPSPR
jgi:hypothetical protein